MATFASTGPTKIKSAMTLVTPAMAMAWLEKNTHNRQLQQSVVNIYARDMAMGRWMITHQGIAFDQVGTLTDGQHRLWAIVESGKSIIMLVTTGLELESQLAIDGGKGRSVRDKLALNDGVKYPHVVTGANRMLARQLGSDQPSQREQMACFKENQKYLLGANELFSRSVKFIHVAPIVVVVARALANGVKRDELSAFCTLLTDAHTPAGVAPEKRDLMVFALHSAITRDRPTPTDVYKKTERILRAWLDGEILNRVVPATHEYFPMPGERPERSLPRTVTPDVRRRRGANIPYIATTRKKTNFTPPPNQPGTKSYKKFITQTV